MIGGEAGCMDKKVLLIEDEPNIIEAISFILSRDGWDVKTHSNGHDAMDAVRTRRPDLVILDVMLPGKSGFDILQEIRADSELAATPVLMLTARGQVKDRELAEKSGVSRYMTKPFANADVLEAVRSMVCQ
jgi:two-component system OmpR family response regulator